MIVFGHSHLVTLRSAAEDAQLNYGTLIHLDESDRFTNPLVLDRSKGDSSPNPAVMAQLDKAGAFKDDADVISIVGGNAHNIVGLLRHDRPFGIVLPGSIGDQATLPPATEVIAYEMMIRHFQCRNKKYTDFLRLLRPLVKGRLWHVESPPPCPDEEFINNNIDTYFKDRVSLGLNAAHLRHRLWRCHSDMIRRNCEELGISFIPAPPDTMDTDGFLLPEGWGNATHGNNWYGLRTLDHIKHIVDGASF